MLIIYSFLLFFQGVNIVDDVSADSIDSEDKLGDFYYSGTSIEGHDNYFLLLGGAIDNQVYSDQVQLFKRRNDTSFERVDHYTMPIGISSVNIAVADSYFYALGGYDVNGLNDRFFRFEIFEDKIISSELASLPLDTVLTNATVFDDKLWIGGRDGEENGYWMYELPGGNDGKWVFSIGKTGPKPAIIVPQNIKGEEKLIEFAHDRTANEYTISYFADGSFTAVRSFSKDNSELINAYPSGFSSVILLFRGEAGFNLSQYNTITNQVSPLSVPYDLNSIAINKSGSEFIVVGNNGGAYDISLHPISKRSGLKLPDIIVLCFYFSLLIFMGYYFSKRNNSIDDYFRGGKRTPGWAIGISIVATTLSAVSFMSLPGVSFSTNLVYIFMPLGNLVALIFVIFWVLPFYIRLDITSAYEYLELRFSSLVRLAGSIVFITGVLFRLGIIILLPAIIISVVTGFDIFLCIALMGVISTVYTIMGGIEAVIWSDVLQVSILISGVLIGIAVILFQLDLDMGHVVDTASSYDKLVFADTDYSLSKVTVWVLIFYAFGRINVFLSNQTIIQRLVSAKDEREAGKSMIYNAVIGIPVFVLLLLFGVFIFVFYFNFPESLSPYLQSQDELVPNFIISELPLGLSGILIAAIFAASMSTLDSTINSTSTVITKDLYIKYNWNIFGIDSFTFAKYMTGILGFLGTLTALQLAKYDIPSIFNIFIEIIGIFGGGLAGVFLLGIFSVRGNPAGAISGLLTSIILILYIKNFTEVHFFLFAFIGMSSSYLFGYVYSLLLRKRSANLNGLTIFTLENENKRAKN